MIDYTQKCHECGQMFNDGDVLTPVAVQSSYLDAHAIHIEYDHERHHAVPPHEHRDWRDER